MSKPIRNIGILSHVDAGKTTITEQFLFLGGAVKTPGDVNKGTTVSDNLEIERQRGVSVRSADLSFRWKNCQINLIDTPGHTDFSAEVERSLQIMDGAILVISAVEGLQAHTFALWGALKSRNIPVIFFINKIDRQGADFARVIDEIEKDFDLETFSLASPRNEGTNDADVINLLDEYLHEKPNANFEHALENLSNYDEEIMEAFLEGEKIEPSKIIEKLKYFLEKKKLFPVYTGVAKARKGIDELLDATLTFFPDAGNPSGELSALVYKIEHHPALGRLAHVRVFDGEIKVRDKVLNLTKNKEEKVAQIKKSFGGKMQDLGKLDTGDIGILSGLSDVSTSEILGSKHRIPTLAKVQVPMMTVQIKPIVENEFTPLAHAMEILNIEDPKLGLRWYKEDNELHLILMGKIQMEILELIILERFGLQVEFSQPSIIYKETPKKAGTGFASYTMPKPCWAVITFAIEPGERGSGITYSSMVSVDKIKQKYQNEIRENIHKALDQGIKGWEVCDIKITLIEGEDHEVHSRPGDFILATPMALMNGLTKTDTTLLEPILNFAIKAPEDLLGKVAGDLHQMRGTFSTPNFYNGNFELKGKVPAATSLDYGIKLGSMSGGKGHIRFKFDGYKPCTDEQGTIRPYKGVNPLDRSQWILHARGAFKADDRKM